MSRRLAITVGEVMPREGSAFRNPQNSRTPHLIVIDQDTGKTLMLNLEATARQYWQALPPVPLEALGKQAEPVALVSGRSCPCGRMTANDCAGECGFTSSRSLRTDMEEGRL